MNRFIRCEDDKGYTTLIPAERIKKLHVVKYNDDSGYNYGIQLVAIGDDTKYDVYYSVSREESEDMISKYLDALND